MSQCGYRLHEGTKRNPLGQWSATNQQPLAPRKCTVLQLGKRYPRRKYELEYVELQVTDCVTDLGFRLCPSLSSRTRVEEITKNASKRLFLLFRILKSGILNPVHVCHNQATIQNICERKQMRYVSWHEACNKFFYRCVHDGFCPRIRSSLLGGGNYFDLDLISE